MHTRTETYMRTGLTYFMTLVDWNCVLLSAPSFQIFLRHITPQLPVISNRVGLFSLAPRTS
jgi:hypothetical protein